ncbi:MAG: carboxypeptidase regulatory-like domain-containing protein [Acidobacteriota bacterium]|nr:carboxypeptidase regulatory-like domain-containing protein [Acidobacteriota bacterium]
MKLYLPKAFHLRLIAYVLCIALSSYATAQTSSGSIHGKVADPSGAVIPSVTVTATASDGRTFTGITNQSGSYEIKGLRAGNYVVTAAAPGFSAYRESDVTVTPPQARLLDISLNIEVAAEKVAVQDEGNTLDVNPSNNAGALTIKGKDLEALSDDPDQLQSDLQALAGPSAGPNGGQIYIDGFTGGQIPPKSSIREIRVNQNPFSAEYEKLGYGRIEIFTKPGTDKYHGQIFFNDNDSVLNTQSPFLLNNPGYNSQMYNGTLSGPLRKKASFFINFERRNINDVSAVNASVLDAAFNPTIFNQSLKNPRTRTNFSPRLDYQLSASNTLTARYQFTDRNETDDGVGQLALASQAYNVKNTEHTIQISDTQIVSPSVINETRFQYERQNNSQIAQNLQPTINVQGAFTAGGNRIGRATDTQNRYELQNYTSVSHGNHFIRFGGRLRAMTESSQSTANFNGTFVFPSLVAYQITQLGLQQGQTAAQIRAAGGGASQFSLTSGQTLASVSTVDAGLFAGDDWRIRPTMTFSYGLRFETQNHIYDHADVAPRLSFAWAIGGGAKKIPQLVLRAGFGIFYDRFGSDFVLQSERLNGIAQQQTIVQFPNFYPDIPSPGSISGGLISPTVYRIAAHLRAPQTIQTAISAERQLSKAATVSVTYINSRGGHQLLLRNINAPAPGTNPSNGPRPFGGTTNIYEYESEGVFRQNQLIANLRITAGSKVSLFSFYTLNYAHSDLGTLAGSSGGAFSEGGSSLSFPSNQYSLGQDYGRASFDVRHRMFLGGSISLPWTLRLSPFVIATSGQPYNITVGHDLNSDSIFNDRPAFPTSSTAAANLLVTRLGSFDVAPNANANLIPINYGNGPGAFSVNLRLSKTFGLGKKVDSAPGGGMGGRGPGGGGPGLGGRGLSGGGGQNPFGPGPGVNRRFNLTISAAARNLFNRVNLATPIGTLDSPLFGKSVALAGGPFSSSSANRRIDLQIMLSF